MAWLWWLLAPIASTALGAGVLMLLARREAGVARRRTPDAMAEHRAMLSALGRAEARHPTATTVLARDPNDASRIG